MLRRGLPGFDLVQEPQPLLREEGNVASAVGEGRAGSWKPSLRRRQWPIHSDSSGGRRAVERGFLSADRPRVPPRIRDRSRVASSESPPSRKKSSSGPSRSRPRTAGQDPLNLSSTIGVREPGRIVRPNYGAGAGQSDAAASSSLATLPAGPFGTSSHDQNGLRQLEC